MTNNINNNALQVMQLMQNEHGQFIMLVDNMSQVELIQAAAKSVSGVTVTPLDELVDMGDGNTAFALQLNGNAEALNKFVFMLNVKRIDKAVATAFNFLGRTCEVTASILSNSAIVPAATSAAKATIGVAKAAGAGAIKIGGSIIASTAQNAMEAAAEIKADEDCQATYKLAKVGCGWLKSKFYSIGGNATTSKKLTAEDMKAMFSK